VKRAHVKIEQTVAIHIAPRGAVTLDARHGGEEARVVAGVTKDKRFRRRVSGHR
jgi:hypothetical protein